MTTDNASGAGMDLHAWIMNIPCAEVDANAEWSDRRIAYKMGHQHARHAAAELALDATRLLAESQAQNAKLEAQVERLSTALAEMVKTAKSVNRGCLQGMNIGPFDLNVIQRADAALKP